MPNGHALTLVGYGQVIRARRCICGNSESVGHLAALTRSEGESDLILGVGIDFVFNDGISQAQRRVGHECAG